MPLPLIYIFHPYIRYIYNYYIVHIIACSISSASAPRTSPTIMRSPLRMKKRKNKREANRSPSLHAYLQMQTLIFLSAAAFTAASASSLELHSWATWM